MKTLTTSLAALTLAAGVARADEVRIMWYSDGVEGEVMQDLLDRFEETHPEIDVVLDTVSYQAIQEQLPIQLASGQGPDIARVTNLKEQAQHWLDLRPYLDDAAYWDENFGDRFDWMREDGSDAIPGFLTQLTLTGGLRQRHPLRTGRRRDAGRGRDLGRLDRSLQAGDGEPATPRRLRHRPLGPPDLGSERELRCGVHRGGRDARAD